METWATVTAITLPLVTLAGFVLTVVWNVRKHRETQRLAEDKAYQIALTDAEERGKMEERQAIVEKQIDAAHAKIRDLDQRQDASDAKMIELSNDVKHILKSVDTLVAIHTKKD